LLQRITRTEAAHLLLAHVVRLALSISISATRSSIAPNEISRR
jgi:hypothetical protein